MERESVIWIYMMRLAASEHIALAHDRMHSTLEGFWTQVRPECYTKATNSPTIAICCNLALKLTYHNQRSNRKSDFPGFVRAFPSRLLISATFSRIASSFRVLRAMLPPPSKSSLYCLSSAALWALFTRCVTWQEQSACQQAAAIATLPPTSCGAGSS